MNSCASKIGTVIRRKREGLGMARDDFAEKIDKSVGFVGQLERGETMPKVETLHRIVKVLELDANTLFNDEDINADVMAELNTIIQQLSDRDQKFLLSFARLLLQYSQGDSK